MPYLSNADLSRLLSTATAPVTVHPAEPAAEMRVVTYAEAMRLTHIARTDRAERAVFGATRDVARRAAEGRVTAAERRARLANTRADEAEARARDLTRRLETEASRGDVRAATAEANCRELSNIAEAKVRDLSKELNDSRELCNTVTTRAEAAERENNILRPRVATLTEERDTLAAKLREALAKPAPANPLDEADKSQRLDGDGDRWYWSGNVWHWAEGTLTRPTLADLNRVHGPITFA